MSRRLTIHWPVLAAHWSTPASLTVTKNLLAAIRKKRTADTIGSNILKTLELVFAAYESAAHGSPVIITPQLQELQTSAG